MRITKYYLNLQKLILLAELKKEGCTEEVVSELGPKKESICILSYLKVLVIFFSHIYCQSSLAPKGI